MGEVLNVQYLWLEERARISDSCAAPNQRSNKPYQCFYHREEWKDRVKCLIEDLQGSLLPSDEGVYNKLENVLCSCKYKASQARVSRDFGISAGTNLPHLYNEEKMRSLIEYFYNWYNENDSLAEIVENAEEGICVNYVSQTLLKVKKTMLELLENLSCKGYDPCMTRLLSIIKVHMAKALVDYCELPLKDFCSLYDGPYWEEMKQELRTKYCSNLFFDLNTDILARGHIGLAIEAPSLHELKCIKQSFVTYMEKTRNPPTEQSQSIKQNTETEPEENQVKPDEIKQEVMTQSVDEKNGDAKECQDTETAKSEASEEVQQIAKVYQQERQSMERWLSNCQTLDKNSENFVRSKSLPAGSGLEKQIVNKSDAKRARYDTEVNNEFMQTNPVQEFTIYKETLSIVLKNHVEQSNLVITVD